MPLLQEELQVINQYLKVLRLPGDVRHFYPGDVVHPGEVHPHRLPHVPALHNSVAGDKPINFILKEDLIIVKLSPSFLISIFGLFTFLRQESNVDELAMELLLLLVILPAVQDQNQGREWLKYLVTRCKFSLFSL